MKAMHRDLRKNMVFDRGKHDSKLFDLGSKLVSLMYVDPTYNYGTYMNLLVRAIVNSAEFSVNSAIQANRV